jgi:hypothetical protein
VRREGDKDRERGEGSLPEGNENFLPKRKEGNLISTSTSCLWGFRET